MVYKKIFFLVVLLLVGKGDLYAVIAYKAHLSGSWYPSKKQHLHATLLQKDEQAAQKYDFNLESSTIKALIVPHAGYSFSGAVAAAAYRLITPGTFDRVIVLAPSHFTPFTGVALLDEGYGSYRTPLGRIPFDSKMIKELVKSSSLFSFKTKAYELEHAVEVQLPFIQKYCGKNCKVVPLLVGDISLNQSQQIAKTLKKYCNGKTLVVVSSDFTHHGERFGYKPFTKDITQNIYQLDSAFVKAIEDQRLDDFSDIVKKTKATVCGRRPLMILLALLEQKAFGNVESYVVGYDTSASDEKNPDHSVSYVSLVFSTAKRSKQPLEHQLTGYEKNSLLKLARNRLQEVAVSDDKQVQFQSVMDYLEKAERVVPGLVSKAMRQVQGSFITLYEIGKDGTSKLRGCIGNIVGKMPLYQTVYNMTKSAALHDSRFSSVKASQVPHINISISVLTPPYKIDSYKDIQLGRDGIWLLQSGASSVYLPKVATEQGWNLEQTLQSLSRKAGLSSNAWKDKKTIFKVFQSIDFAEPKEVLQLLE